jgi:hypothetical protein
VTDFVFPLFSKQSCVCCAHNQSSTTRFPFSPSMNMCTYTHIYRFCLSCHHVICKECWADGLSAYVDSVESLRTTCFTSCDMVVPRSVFQKFLNQENFSKYERWLAKKFVECSSKLRYCPKPGCNVSVFALLKI